jgi:fructose/tagatose bisphosphate aldolase
MFLSVPKHTKTVYNTDRRTLSAATGTGHGCGAGGGVVFDVEGLEDVTAVGATE